MLNNERILVTGGLGYIGCVLVGHLNRLGHQTIVVDSDLFRDAGIAEMARPTELLRRDVRDLRVSDFDGIDTVMHLAALSNDPLGNLDARLTHEINCDAATHCARLAREACVKRFLFSSSCSSYGAAGDELLDENAGLHPVTAYGESKVNAEAAIQTLASDSFCVTSLRNATAYGFSPRLRLDVVVNDFAAAAHIGKRILIKSDGTPWRPLVHVRDICSAFVAISQAKESAVQRQAFNVGASHENYRVSELAEIVAAQVEGCTIEYEPGGGPDRRCYRVSCEKLRLAVPGFVPQWDVCRGTAELLDAFAKYGLTNDWVAEGRFNRLSGLQRRQQAGDVDSRLKPLRYA